MAREDLIMENPAEFVEQEARRLREGDPAQLQKLADSLGIRVESGTRISALAQDVAEKIAKQEYDQRTKNRYSDLLGVEWASNPILKRFIDAIGGIDWLLGPTPVAARCRGYVHTLTEVLDEMSHEGANAEAPEELDGYPAADVAGFLFHGVMAAAREDDRISIATDPRLIRTQSADYIVNIVLPRVLAHFLRKNADYGDQHRTGLGVKAEYVGLHRKMAKLQKVLWEDQEMNHEGPQEMLCDIIGACLLILDLLDMEE